MYFNIEIDCSKTSQYKSIRNLRWSNIPTLAVLTGRNGSGKTQLLELLAYKLSGAEHSQVPDLSQIDVRITGESFGQHEISYLPSSGTNLGVGSVNMGNMAQLKHHLYEELRSSNIMRDVRRRIKRARLEKLLGVQNLESITQQEFVARLPDDFVFMLEDDDVTNGLAHVFVAYRLRLAEEREKNKPEEKIHEELGPAPWDVLNTTLETAEFPYRVVTPLGSRMIDNFEIRLVNELSGRPLQPMDLSSGEQMILRLVLWLYNSQHHDRFPRLFLLDEPDAHLHPSLTRQFMNVIREVLVERYKVKVILTTHSPSTVALAPENAVFEMSRGDPEIRPSIAKENTIGLLTAGFVFVSPSTRYVMVEDEDDINFYNAIREILSDYGPSRDPKALRPAPSLVFLPASLGEGKAKVSGGWSNVVKWVDKFDAPPLDQIFRGVIDRDAGNTQSERIQVIGRYSIENYLLDPIVVFGLLAEEGIKVPNVGMQVSSGDEHLLRTFPREALQAIVNAIDAQVAPHLPNVTAAERTKSTVTFTNGQELDYPSWTITRRGHELLPIYQDAFGGSRGPRLITSPKLLRSLRRVRLIPVELANLLHKLQE